MRPQIPIGSFRATTEELRFTNWYFVIWPYGTNDSPIGTSRGGASSGTKDLPIVIYDLEFEFPIELSQQNEPSPQTKKGFTMAITDSRLRLTALRKLLADGEISTQEELADELRRLDFDITQSTISRDLRRVGAVKTQNAQGETVYRHSAEINPVRPILSSNLKNLLLDIQNNDSLIVIHTAPGSASLVARHLDEIWPEGILGTIAGDDTIFIAVASKQKIKGIIAAIYESMG